MTRPLGRLARASWLLAAALVPAPASALDPSRPVSHYHNRVWGVENGLPQSAALALAQTPDGYLWIGTQEGLVRFDGVHFRVFDPGNTPELRHPIVRTLAVDGEGALWVGTLGGGLTRVHEGAFTTFGRAAGLPDERVRVVYVEPGGQVWVGSHRGLSRFEGGRFVQVDDWAGVPIRSVLRTRDGSLWVGTRGRGLWRLQDGSLARYATADGLPHDTVLSLHEDATGRLWIGTLDGLAYWREGRLVRETALRAPARERVVEVIRSDRAGNVWIGTHHGLVRYRNGVFETYDRRRGLSENVVESVLEDREGILWVGTRAGGLNRLLDGRSGVLGSGSGLSDDFVWAVHEDAEGDVWIGTNTGGLNRVRRGAVRAYTARDGLSCNTVYAVWRDRRGDVWAGTPCGLNRLRGDRITVVTKRDGLADDLVHAVIEDRAGDVWVATSNGLNRLRDGRLEALTLQDGLSSSALSTLLEGRDGSLWIGTLDAGLDRLHQGQVTHYLDGLTVFALHEDEAGVLWIGTGGGGLARLKDGQIVRYRAADGLPSDTVFSILEDAGGHLWLSSNRGVFHLRRQDLEDFASGRLGRLPAASHDGGQGPRGVECNGGGTHPAGWKMRDGSLWFATLDGALMVDPTPAAPGLPPLVRIEQVSVDQKVVPQARELELPVGGATLAIEYTGLSFRAPERVHFRYQLEGFDDGWQEAGTRRAAYYTNIPPGRYRFRVVASGGDNGWTEAASIALRVPPRFHQTAWFYLLVGAALASVAVALHRFRVRLVEARAALFEERTRIAQEVHDGVAQTVGGIGMQIEAARNAPDASDSTRHLERAQGLADGALEDLRRSVWALRPALLEGRGLPEALERVLEQLTADTEVAARLEVEGCETELPQPLEEGLLRIAQEAIFNATRHGRPRRVHVVLTYARHHVQIRICDDGQGFSSRGGRRGGFGVQSMRQRAERLGGRLAVGSGPGRGTEVRARFDVRGRGAGVLRSVWRRFVPWAGQRVGQA